MTLYLLLPCLAPGSMAEVSKTKIQHPKSNSPCDALLHLPNILKEIAQYFKRNQQIVFAIVSHKMIYTVCSQATHMWELISTRQRLIELINFLDTVGNCTGVNAINKAKDMLRVCRAGVLKHRRYKRAA